MSLTPELYELILKIIDERIKDIKVTREEFDKLAKVVSDLALNVKELSQRINELAEAQKKTEYRLDKIEELLAKQEERLNRLEELVAKQGERLSKLEELIAKQGERLTKLEELVAKQDERITKLEDRTGRLENAVIELTKAVERLAREVEGLKETVGFGLEDIARVVLPGWVERHLRIKIDEFERKFLYINGNEIEINLYSEGFANGEKYAVIAETKSRINKKDVEKFVEKIEQVKKVLTIKCIGILFGYLIYPAATEEALRRGVYVVATYQR